MANQQHTTYRGRPVDMESLRRKNEDATALGNMGVNARGDKISGGKVTKTADQMAREKHRTQSVIAQSSLKGDSQLDASHVGIQQGATGAAKEAGRVAPKVTKTSSTEVELPNGDIVITDDGKADEKDAE